MGIVEELAKNATSVNPFGLPRSADCASVIGGKDPVVFGSARYYALCGFGGMLSCGLTHTAIVPLDLIKCRIQVNPEKYKGILGGFRTTLSEEGVRALGKGWAPTLVGYSLQGLGKFGFYELFKILYTDMLGEEKAYLWRTSLYLAASASAEFFADIMLAPMEATKVRIQTSPGAPPTLRGCAPLIYKSEGLRGFYKGLPPLWMRQIPYTMMKFACFERTVELLYAKVVPKPRDQCSKGEQLVVTFIAGYIAGVFCAVVSHPADTIVSKLNQDAGASAVDILKKLGPIGVWGGLVPRIVMIGTLTALQWFIYDGVKVALGIPRPPPLQAPLSLMAKEKLDGITHKIEKDAHEVKKWADKKGQEAADTVAPYARSLQKGIEKTGPFAKEAKEYVHAGVELGAKGVQKGSEYASKAADEIAKKGGH
ncbi:Phosphate carrier protein, mitochondrial [Aphelenchoides besseyi]|nr:Phosphate carrier protein, mitochondrial [Aphelenchoides besseyi]